MASLNDAPVIPVLLIGTGLYLAWFGVKYWEDTKVVWPSDPIKDVLQGKGLPSHTTATTTAIELTSAESQQATAGAAASSGSSSGGGGAPSPSGPGENAWIRAFLTAIGAPDTPANQNSMTHWISHESSWPPGARNNPLNTTQNMPGATNFNSIGVKNYPTASEGIAATKMTIENGLYSDILGALRSGGGLCNRTWAGLSKWSGGGYSSVC